MREVDPTRNFDPGVPLSATKVRVTTNPDLEDSFPRTRLRTKTTYKRGRARKMNSLRVSTGGVSGLTTVTRPKRTGKSPDISSRSEHVDRKVVLCVWSETLRPSRKETCRGPPRQDFKELQGYFYLSNVVGVNHKVLVSA